MLEEFKKFAMRGNVVDLAVGVIIGAAFGAIVSSLVGDIIMPLIGAVTGGLDFSNYLPAAVVQGDGGGLWRTRRSKARCWLGAISSPSRINFIIIAWVLFCAHGRQPAEGRRAAQGAAGHQAGAAADRDPRPAEEPLMAA